MDSEVITSNSSLKEFYNDCLEEGENPLSAFATQSLYSTFTTETPYSTDLEEVIAVAPGEVKNPVLVLTDTCCEKMAHPHPFSSGRYGYKVPKNIPISANEYFNQRLLNYSQVFYADSDHIFFEHSVMQKI